MQCRKENGEEAFVRAITALPAGSKIGISKGFVVALGALMQAKGTDGKRHTMKDDGYLTWIQILTLILFIFVLGMAAGSFITVRAYRWANQFAQVTAPLVTATTAPTTRSDNDNDDKDRDENDDDPEPDHLQLDTRDSAVQLGEWEGRRLGTAGLS